METKVEIKEMKTGCKFNFINNKMIKEFHFIDKDNKKVCSVRMIEETSLPFEIKVRRKEQEEREAYMIKCGDDNLHKKPLYEVFIPVELVGLKVKSVEIIEDIGISITYQGLYDIEFSTTKYLEDEDEEYRKTKRMLDGLMCELAMIRNAEMTAKLEEMLEISKKLDEMREARKGLIEEMAKTENITANGV